MLFPILPQKDIDAKPNLIETNGSVPKAEGTRSDDYTICFILTYQDVRVAICPCLCQWRHQDSLILKVEKPTAAHIHPSFIEFYYHIIFLVATILQTSQVISLWSLHPAPM